MPEECISGEQWRNIPGWPRYQVSNRGRVQGKRGIRKLFRSKSGYVRVALYAGDAQSNRYVHRLMLLAFVGEPGEGMVCRHLNGDNGDNRLENLAWGTYEENEADKRRHGTHNSKLTEAKVLEIRRRYATGEDRKRIAKDFGVSGNQIRMVGAGKSWVWVGGPRTTGHRLNW